MIDKVTQSIRSKLEYLYLSERSIKKFDLKRKRINSLYPQKIQIQTINKCNGSCIMCPYSAKKSKAPLSTMNRETFIKIVNELSKAKGVNRIYLALQNEPLLDKEIISRIKIFKNNLPTTTKIGIVTNGALLTKENIDDLVRSKIDLIEISLDALSKQTYKKIRNGLDYDKIMGNLEYLIRYKKKLSITVKMVRQKHNIHEEKDFLNYWKKKGISVHVFGLSNRCDRLDNYDDIKPKQKISFRLKNYLGKILIPCCPLPFQAMSILYNGDVIVCCHDWNHEIILGNINHNSIKEIWNNESINKIRSKLYRKEKHKIPLCKGCVIN